MIYVLAFLLPPLALLLEGKLFSAIFNIALLILAVIVTAITLFWASPLLLAPSFHAIVAIAQSRRQREHREIVDAIRERRAKPEDYISP